MLGFRLSFLVIVLLGIMTLSACATPNQPTPTATAASLAVVKRPSITPTIPTAVPTFEVPKAPPTSSCWAAIPPSTATAGRTDTIMIVTINPDGPTASMISLPRDLYVYIPGYTMNRINTALARGEEVDYADGGIGMLKQTILYNFGIPIHYYAQVDFQGFQDIVDAMGGVDLAVSCERSDWRLISPELDVEDPENWEVFTLNHRHPPPGWRPGPLVCPQPPARPPVRLEPQPPPAAASARHVQPGLDLGPGQRNSPPCGPPTKIPLIPI
jgi:LCP family protein required for cell wall assembly